MRPSAKTSIFAPTRCGVEPVVEMMVTSAAGSPRSSASATAANTSRFTLCRLYVGRVLLDAPASAMQIALLGGFGSSQERFPEAFRAVRRDEFARLRIDVREGDALRHVERDTGPAG